PRLAPRAKDRYRMCRAGAVVFAVLGATCFVCAVLLLLASRVWECLCLINAGVVLIAIAAAFEATALRAEIQCDLIETLNELWGAR
ncbi:MAG: hypothetical protein WC083_06885, partial [Candidatus Methanomethylophilaceae archaeon]